MRGTELTILGATDFVTNLEESLSGLVTRTISKKKSNSNNNRKHRVEFLSHLVFTYKASYMVIPWIQGIIWIAAHTYGREITVFSSSSSKNQKISDNKTGGEPSPAYKLIDKKSRCFKNKS